jgi:autotransporter passenger strand-loop-strand repeat protein
VVLSNSGYDSGTTINGGVEDDYGSAVGDHVFNGGTLVASGGGIISSALFDYTGQALIESGGTMISGIANQSGNNQQLNAIIDVINGGTAEFTQIFYNNVMQIASGGTDISATISGSASAAPQQPFGALLVVQSGAVAISDSIEASGKEEVFGVASNTVVSGVGAEIVTSDGGMVIGATVLLNGVLDVFGSGTAIGATIDSGGYENVGNSGIDSGAVVSSGGTFNVLAGGTAFYTHVLAGLSAFSVTPIRAGSPRRYPLTQ